MSATSGGGASRAPAVAAAVSALGTTTLIVLMDWLPTPLNRNITTTTVQTRLPGTLVHAGTGLAISALHLTRRRRPALLGATWYSAVLASAVNNWWLPYLLDLELGEIDAATYAAEYADDVTVLPPIGDHPVVPDLQHLLIHTSVGLSCVLSWVAFASTSGPRAQQQGHRSRRARPHSPRTHRPPVLLEPR